jgi:hypothetical protein
MQGHDKRLEVENAQPAQLQRSLDVRPCHQALACLHRVSPHPKKRLHNLDEHVLNPRRQPEANCNKERYDT